MDYREHDSNIDDGSESRRSREEVMDTIRRALLSTGLRPTDPRPPECPPQPSRGRGQDPPGADPYNSTGRLRVRDTWSRR